MSICRVIRKGTLVAGLMMGIGVAQSVKATQTDPLDDGGRVVTPKPISSSDLGGYGEPDWRGYLAVAGIALLAVGGLVTGKLIE